jgi:D-beta-D-heptose 7-phosphate kinase/D-beta-D-heptose 1-phosphate adenosyltransferase
MSVSFRERSNIPEIVPWERLAQIIRELQQAGHKVVFTNGVFDLIHPGHIRYLREARALGDMLVVALNSDESVTRIKGPQRPILPLTERARILAALEPVDYLTAFEQDTPEQVIAMLRPDILVKGGDYTPDQVVGRDLVESYGGVCRTLTFANGFSTTGIIGRILEMTNAGRG